MPATRFTRLICYVSSYLVEESDGTVTRDIWRTSEEHDLFNVIQIIKMNVQWILLQTSHNGQAIEQICSVFLVGIKIPAACRLFLYFHCLRRGKLFRKCRGEGIHCSWRQSWWLRSHNRFTGLMHPLLICNDAFFFIISDSRHPMHVKWSWVTRAAGSRGNPPGWLETQFW